MSAFNCMFGFPIHSDDSRLYAPTSSGGSWEATLPFSNTKTRHVSRVARSTDAATASTQREIDLGTTRGIRLFALLGHNLSLAAMVRFRVSATAGDFVSPVYDSGWVAAHSVIYPSGTLTYEHPSFWTGMMSDEELLYNSVPVIHIADVAQLGRYVLLEIDDTTNPDGYVEIGRLVLAAVWQTSINMEYGASIGIEDPTERILTDGTATLYRERANRRKWTFTIGHLDEDEALVHVFDMQRRLGRSGQLFFIWDPTDEQHRHRRAGLAVFADLSPIEHAYFGATRAAFSLIEEL